MTMIMKTTTRKWNDLLNLGKQFQKETLLFEADENGLSDKDVDAEHVAMLHVLAKPSYFDTYECTEPMKICINIAKVQNVMRMFTPSQSIRWEISLNFNKLMISSNIGIGANLNLIETSGHNIPKTPEMTHRAKYEVDSKTLYKTFNSIDKLDISESIKFTGYENSILLHSGDEECIEHVINSANESFNEEVSSIFPTHFLMKIFKQLKGLVEIDIDDDYPLMVMQETDDLIIKEWLAPRIDCGSD